MLCIVFLRCLCFFEYDLFPFLIFVYLPSVLLECTATVSIFRVENFHLVVFVIAVIAERCVCVYCWENVSACFLAGLPIDFESVVCCWDNYIPPFNSWSTPLPVPSGVVLSSTFVG